MLSRNLAAVCSLAAALCLTAAAQSSPSAPASSSAPSQGQSAPSSPSAPQATPKLQLQNLPPDPTTPTPAEIAARREQLAVQSALRLANVEAHWGPDMSSPGTFIHLVEAGRSKTANGATQVTYHIQGSGFPAGEKLRLLRWPLNESAQILMGGIGFNAQGIAVCTDAPLPAGGTIAAPAISAPVPHVDDHPGAPAPSCAKTMQTNQPVALETTASAGEPLRVALVSEDRKKAAAITAVPFPIQGTDQGCKLQVVLGVRDADLVLVEGSGFPPSAAVKLTSVTYGQLHNLNAKTNAAGHLIFALLPAAKDHPSGETTVRYDGIVQPAAAPGAAPATPASTCGPAVTFHWGQGSYKPQ